MSKRRKLIISVAVLFVLNILLICFTQGAFAATYREGSRGDMVKKIQEVLKREGYYKGGIDGAYGKGTADAVRAFQRACGLTVDGICGPITIKYLGLEYEDRAASASGASAAQPASSYTNDLNLLARIISAESRGEPYSGQVAVGAVVMNRVKHPSFPNSLSGVVYQNGAFTAVTDGQFNQPVAESAYRAAKEAINGNDPSGGAIYYYNPATATSKWILTRPRYVSIGRHVFCG